MKQKKLFNSILKAFNYALINFRNEEIKQYKDKYFIAGVTNYLWQTWNRFWKEYWISTFKGYIDISGSKINRNGILTSNDGYEISYHILYLIGKRNSPYGKIKGTYQEITWGSLNNIVSIATALNRKTGQYNNILSYSSLYSLSINHLQTTRNALIHLDRENMLKLKSDVLPYYSLSEIKHPIELLFSNPLKSPIITYKK